MFARSSKSSVLLASERILPGLELWLSSLEEIIPGAPAELVPEDPIELWIADLDQGSGGEAFRAARELGKSGAPRAIAALMERLQRREFQKVAGAATFFASLDDPSLDPLLLDLLHETTDLAVAQAFIQSGRPALAEASIAWAEGIGFTWDGETLQQ